MTPLFAATARLFPYRRWQYRVDSSGRSSDVCSRIERVGLDIGELDGIFGVFENTFGRQFS